MIYVSHLVQSYLVKLNNFLAFKIFTKFLIKKKINTRIKFRQKTLFTLYLVW